MENLSEITTDVGIKTKGVIPFVTEVARYFMDFLETDFHKVRNPKRYIQTRNSSNLQVSINLNKYKKYSSLVWSVIRKGFDDDALSELKRGVHITTIPKSLLNLIQEQILLLKQEEIDEIVKLFSYEIEQSVQKNPNDSTLALTFALDGIKRVIQDKFLAPFITKVREPLESLRNSTVDSIYLIEEELSNILVLPFEDVVSSIVNQLSIEQQIDIKVLLTPLFELKDIQNKLETFFEGFAAGDLFFEVSELVNNKTILEKQELYLYFCDITFGNNTYPIFYIPVQIDKTLQGFNFTFDTLLYVNKKAVQFISQSFNDQIERKGSLGALFERIIYLSENRQHFIGEVDSALKELINYFGLEPYIDTANPERQVAKGKNVQVSNSCYLGLFDKSDESLVNDYEEILLKLKEGDSILAQSFQTLIDDFITNNPESVVREVGDEWDEQPASEKLVYTSPVPLNEEQRQILNALQKTKCKYITVEGPPGTGKSHTITAIACDAILKNQTVLVLSDKKEALDVVEDKITETMNKVRLDKDFQNPILRLGQTGNTYSKILSTTSMERIKDHFKAVKNEYKKLETNIDLSVSGLKSQVTNTITAYDKISLVEIAEFTRLENEIKALENLPVNLAELEDDDLADENLFVLRKDLLDIKEILLQSDSSLSNLFKGFYPTDLSLTSFRNFLSFLGIIEEIKTVCNDTLPQLAKVRSTSIDGLAALEGFISQCDELKSGFLGYLFKKKKLKELAQELGAKLPNSIEEPYNDLDTLKALKFLFEQALQKKAALELSNAFKFEADFVKAVHQLLTLDIRLPTSEEVAKLKKILNDIEEILSKYEKTKAITGIDYKDIFTLIDNRLVNYPQSDFDKLVRYLCLKANFQEYFTNIPSYNYVEQKNMVEGLVTTQMTHKMDERVIDFTENHRNDAKTLTGIISKKQRFDKNVFDKLKNSFPCILAGIRDFAEYIPLEAEIFDIIIIDEASQVSIAQAFPALLRGKKIIVLGDKKQFSNVKSSHARSDTNREYLNRLRDVFLETISDEGTKLERLGKFNIKTSILDFFERISNYNIMLKKHFRGYREIISYSSKYFYDDNLQAIKIRALPIEQVIKFEFIQHDERIEAVENTNQLEIEAIVSEVERIALEEKDRSVAIITPHTNQQKLLLEAFSRHPNNEEFQKNHKLKIMTFDTCQGEERDIILYSMVANPVSDKLWGIFIKDRKSVDLEEGGQIKLQRLNVGLSRAKERLHFYLSKPIEEFSGSIGEALQHYQRTLEEAKQLPNADSTDSRSPMEKKVLDWLQETGFFKVYRSSIELHTQFPLGEYIKQLDKRYNHPAYVVDFLLVYTDENQRQQKIIIEYDGFEFHFDNHSEVNEFSYGQYYTEDHVYREKVLESYGYKFIRLNRFNVGKDPIATLNRRLEDTVKKPKSVMH